MADRLGVAVIGCGMAAKPHALALCDLHNDIDVIGVHARNPERCAEFCATWGFPQATDGQALLRDPRVGMVLLLTPPDARRSWLDQAVALGLPVLMEKPVERSVDTARVMVEACETAGLPFGIVFQHRFREASVALRERVASGQLGALRLVKADVPWWREQSYYDQAGRGSYARDGGGVLISQAIHTLDLMLSLTGPVSEVRALSATSAFHTMESEDFVVASLRFENGALGSLTATTAHYPGAPESLEMCFDKATVRLCAGVLELHHRTGEKEVIGETTSTGGGADPMAFPHDWHLALIRDFVHAVNTRCTPAVTARDALRVHELIDAITRASASKTAIELSEAT